VKRIILASVTAAILTLILGMLVIALLAPAAHAEDGVRYPGESRQERSWSEPRYLPSWERTQRRYLPSYQYELERRKICGSFCDDLHRHHGYRHEQD